MSAVDGGHAAQILEEGAQGEAHDVVIVAADGLYADLPYPFLDAVGTGLVERLVTLHVIDYLVGHEFAELHFGTFGKRDLAPHIGKRQDRKSVV